MDPNQVLEFKKVTEEYLEKHNIFKLFQELIEGLVVSKPKDPINYLMSRISEEEAYTFFFIAPPGSGVSNLLKEICTEKTGTYLNFGEHILREISEETDFGKEVSTSFKERKLHINEKTQDAFYEAFEGCQKNGKDIWVEGYPKTKLQALNMRNKKILPDLIMIVNKNRADCIRNLVETAFKDLDETTALQKANDSLDEYYLYLQGVKQIYQSNI